MILPFTVHPSVEFFAQYGIEIDTSYFPFLQFRCAVIGCILYLLSDLLFQPPKNEPKLVSKTSSTSSVSLRLFMFLHNVALCIFSVCCFINTAPILYELWTSPLGWKHACQHGWHDKFYNSSYGFWAYLFYISKYYEFIDTWIVIARGRRPIFLQVFHHIGAVFGMWMCMVLQSTGGWIFIVLNSFIHSIMYFYYAASVLHIKLPFKQILTSMQMIQFMVGNSFALWQVYIYGYPGFNVIALADQFTILYHVVYTGILFILFNKFYKKTYTKAGKEHEKTMKKLN